MVLYEFTFFLTYLLTNNRTQHKNTKFTQQQFHLNSFQTLIVSSNSFAFLCAARVTFTRISHTF